MSNWILLKRWWARTEAVEHAHFRASIRFRRRHYVWGGSLVIVTAAQSVLQNIDGYSNEWYVLGLSIASPILAALVTFLEYPKRSGEHHNAAARFSALKRELQIEAANFRSRNREELVQVLQDVKTQWDQLTRDSPAIYKNDWSEIGQLDKRIGETAEQFLSEQSESFSESPNNEIQAGS